MKFNLCGRKGVEYLPQLSLIYIAYIQQHALRHVPEEKRNLKLDIAGREF
jgi:hypothetical protein